MLFLRPTRKAMQRYLGLLGLLLLNLPLWGQIRVCAECEVQTIREAVTLAQPHDTIHHY